MHLWPPWGRGPLRCRHHLSPRPSFRVTCRRTTFRTVCAHGRWGPGSCRQHLRCTRRKTPCQRRPSAAQGAAVPQAVAHRCQLAHRLYRLPGQASSFPEVCFRASPRGQALLWQWPPTKPSHNLCSGHVTCTLPAGPLLAQINVVIQGSALTCSRGPHRAPQPEV